MLDWHRPSSCTAMLPRDGRARPFTTPGVTRGCGGRTSSCERGRHSPWLGPSTGDACGGRPAASAANGGGEGVFCLCPPGAACSTGSVQKRQGSHCSGHQVTGPSFHLWRRRRAPELGTRRNWWSCDRYRTWEEVGLYCHWGDDGSRLRRLPVRAVRQALQLGLEVAFFRNLSSPSLPLPLFFFRGTVH